MLACMVCCCWLSVNVRTTSSNRWFVCMLPLSARSSCSLLYLIAGAAAAATAADVMLMPVLLVHVCEYESVRL
jgi:hypothetical protein